MTYKFVHCNLMITKILLKLIIISFLLSSSFKGNTQKFEIGLFGGSSFYNGDLIETSNISKGLHSAFGIITKYDIKSYLTLKANLYYGKISGDDSYSDDHERVQRNLHFRTNIIEGSLQAEINIVKLDIKKYRSCPYLFFGLSIFHFNPEAKYGGEWIKLQPLGTEGQGTTKYKDRKKYNLTQIAVPFGIGWKHLLDNKIAIGIEFGARKTFTDYLDDVSTTFVEPDILEGAHGEISKILSNRSGEIGTRIDYQPTEQRGDANNKDWYYFSGLTVTYLIKNNR